MLRKPRVCLLTNISKPSYLCWDPPSEKSRSRWKRLAGAPWRRQQHVSTLFDPALKSQERQKETGNKHCHHLLRGKRSAVVLAWMSIIDLVLHTALIACVL